MQVQIYRNYDQMSVAAARLIAAQLRIKPDSVLGLATGSTPEGCYRELIRMHREEGLDFSRVSTKNLDEYVGLDPSNENSYRYFMNDKLFNHVNIRKEATQVPDGASADPEKAAEAYEKLCASMPADLQLLGIGGNGHIGFNEPDTIFHASTFVTALKPGTIEANKRFFHSADEVPRHAITMGMRQILQAKKILILISGPAKAEAAKGLLAGVVDPQVPASILQLHPDVVVMLDEAAARDLPAFQQHESADRFGNCYFFAE